MNPLVLLFMALVTFLLGVIALALLPALSIGGLADGLWYAVLGAVILGLVVFVGSFLAALGGRPGDNG